jgi:hypothetical protein
MVNHIPGKNGEDIEIKHHTRVAFLLTVYLNVRIQKPHA